ncbi:uncharacterized protein MPTK1_5g08350 [Marchantia polymorpha subsp. ruderalis]|uniref:Spermatogenesis-associated protein 20-like TRX domain-containing protein n=2 Tax=Marchantia polymorpha TaxID=3197 RepID=A0AAF6BG80_MARPO|nr:hypothetical protein MARPO_0086s0039 [Marchantia polymorpha]BBN11014.1 hypothetical protein Mp_5g08350 [Marchantia polymorpha subsp. ruderalis]|eukprot:PTQ33712.1 hypothetical protein MARPO_0086s0039 [Marchantia polymorpha]
MPAERWPGNRSHVDALTPCAKSNIIQFEFDRRGSFSGARRAQRIKFDSTSSIHTSEAFHVGHAMFCNIARCDSVRVKFVLRAFHTRDRFSHSLGKNALPIRTPLEAAAGGLRSSGLSDPSFRQQSPNRSTVRAQSNMRGDDGTADGGVVHKFTNRLSKEQSPYLLQHARNPVDWFPWGQEAFSKALAEDKPIFLSVGYSTCHWCHVMEVESFENEQVANLMNEWFVNIKVDREERPDVDKVYMTYVQATQGGGGWPMSVFLTPDLKPIVGGTYFAPEDKYGRPGFKTVLKRVKEVWATKKDALREAGDQVVQQLAEATSASSTSQDLPEGIAQQAVQLCANQLTKGFDSKLGGFGLPPKFPRPVEIAVMLQRYKRLDQSGKETAANKALDMALSSLRCMARGGVHDHVGGGFHRYSVDEYWHVPHFEKMLYDQGQLVNVYLDAFVIWKETQYALVARDILDYLRREMTHADGGIFSAEDADSAEFEGAARKKEGAFYVWTNQEIEEVLGEERAAVFATHYYVKPDGNCDLSRMSDPHNEFVGKNVLIERKSFAETAAKVGHSVEDLAEIIGQCREELYAFRQRRPSPQLDDKVIVAWNGLAISAFSRASRILGLEPQGLQYHFPVTGCNPKEYLHAAEKAAAFIRAKLYDEKAKRLCRSYRQRPSVAPGFLDDYSFLINGLLDLYEAGGDTQWLSWALELQTAQDDQFLDKVGGGYYSTAEGDSSILFRVKEDYDGAEPSGNSVAALNLLRLSSLLSGDMSEQFHRTAEHLMSVFEAKVREVAMAIPLMCCAFDSFAGPSKRQIVIAGVKHAPDTDALVTAAHSAYDPDKIILQIDETDAVDQEFWKVHNPMALAMARRSREGKALAYVCQNFTCLAPVSDPQSLEQLLRSPPAAAKVTNFKPGSTVK